MATRTISIKVLPFLIVLSALVIWVEPLRGFFEQLVALFGRCDVEVVRSYIQGFGLWAPAASFGLMLFQALLAPLPAFLLTFANAALFGWGWGALLSWSSAMAGAALCFWLARLLGREVTERLVSRLALDQVDQFFNRHGTQTVLIARLLPFVSFDIVSYGAGLTSMNFRSFIWATAIGQLPATLVYSYAGGMLTGSTRSLVNGLLLLFACGVLAVLLKRVWLQKTTASAEKGDGAVSNSG